MKWIIYLWLFGAVVVSIASGVLVANWVVPKPGYELRAVPAFKQDSGMPGCPGQRQVCPASRTRAASHLQV